MARQERAIRTRRAILVAAAEVFDEVGYEAATISQILQKSGLTKGALYFHYPSKEALAQAVLDAQVRAVPEVPARGLKLQELVDQALLLAHLLGTDPIVRGSIRLTVDQGSAKDGLDRRIPMSAWQDSNTVVLKLARDAGELLPDVDVDRLAKLLVGGFTGVQVLSKIMTDHADMTERVADFMRHLMTSVAVPAVLVRLDFAPERAERVHREADAAAEQDERVDAVRQE
ncbi:MULTISPECIES: ScbR family autoregulator-binding transcription factor [Streptomyces]|uniref:ScbR family autoregulator-binding transcription factor n=1 Tax=Streptomyces TaxID=1883 RepID=UPI0004BD53FD|nr:MULTISPECIES: ScbR family autoregulator-binding transcription factor [Streptomyces]NNG89040.1 TetR/AcrR family transcriptional regulator [Streptomyces cacaoi]QHF98952.1 TetR/AcrR family transcriptional regulator [Streptomyces sp. NHF165]